MAAPIARARAHISELLAEYRIPSAQVGVLQAGTITDFAVGVRDVRSGEPASTDTIYQLGSMSKTWTAVAFMQLVDEGRVHLDEPIRTYLPGFRVADAEVSARLTARRLLNHTNGIEEAYGDPGEGDDVYARIVSTIADAPQVFGLGDTHGYSAVLGYAILAGIMETVEGRSWDEVMRRRVFDRLGLRSTSSRREDVDASRAAVGHVLLPDVDGPVPSPIAYLPRAYGPGGNLSSTVRDVLSMSNIFLDEGRAPDGTAILSPAAVREMTTSVVAVPDPYPCGSHWGLGLTVSEWGGEPVYAHDGSTIGQNARLRIFPDRDLAIAMVTNGVPRDAFYRKAFTALLSELGAPIVPDLPEPDPSIRLDPRPYVGDFERPGARYEVRATGSTLALTFVQDPWQARMAGQPERTTFTLLPISETQFLMPAHGPQEDTQTVAIYCFRDGRARFLHTNARVYPRVGLPPA